MERNSVRILYLINYAGKAGIEKYVANLVRLTEPLGGESLLAYAMAGPLSKTMEAQGVPSLRVSMRWCELRRAARTLAAWCREQGVEVIHAQCPRENVVAVLTKRLVPGLRVVYTGHFTTPCGPLWRRINRWAGRGDDAVIAVCEAAARVMTENGCCRERMVVIPNGMEPGSAPAPTGAVRREFGIGEREILFVSLARCETEKGLDFLIESLVCLRRKTDTPFRCLVAGDGSLLESLRARAREEGLENLLILPGYRTDAAQLLAEGDVYLCSSRCNEALSFSILEAMDAGLPCVVTNVGGNRELAEEGERCGYVLDFGDAEGFADAMARLAQDDALRRALGETARRKVAQRYNLRDQVASVYRVCAGE